MTTFKITPVLIIALFTIWACEKAEDVAGPEEEATPEEELLGTWLVNFLQAEVELTTNKDQRILDGSAQGEGAIEITGDDTATLRYMTSVRSDEYKIHVRIFNRPWYTGEYPTYDLNCYIWSDRGKDIDLFVTRGNRDYRSYSAQGNVSFDFDLDNYELTIDSVLLHDYRVDENVIITGGLAGSTIDIPAYTPTRFTDRIDEDPGESILLMEGGDFVRIFHNNRASTGIWEVRGDTLTLYGFSGEVFHFRYTLDANSLTLRSEADPCAWAEEDPYDYGQCLLTFVYRYDLENQSLTSVIEHLLLELSRSGDEE